MKIIGITGGIGSGKSTVCAFFKELGATVIDADEISRSVTKKTGSAYGETVEFFGRDILLESGEIDRKRLAKIVFLDKEKLKVLNEITHKHIFEEMNMRINGAKTKVVVLDVPLLFSADFKIKCDLKIAVIAPKELRLIRAARRDNCKTADIEARMKNQMSDEEYRARADMCIVNDDLAKTKEQVKKIYESVC